MNNVTDKQELLDLLEIAISAVEDLARWSVYHDDQYNNEINNINVELVQLTERINKNG